MVGGAYRAWGIETSLGAQKDMDGKPNLETQDIVDRDLQSEWVQNPDERPYPNGAIIRTNGFRPLSTAVRLVP